VEYDPTIGKYFETSPEPTSFSRHRFFVSHFLCFHSEDAYKKEYKIDGKDIIIEIIDTAGQEEYSSALQDKVSGTLFISTPFLLETRSYGWFFFNSSFEAVKDFCACTA
jgi:GTPase SAR1 family protein